MKVSKPHSIDVTKRLYKESMRLIGLKGITIDEFAKSIGTTGSNLNRMDKAPRNFATLENCCLLAKNYGTSVQWLLTGEIQAASIDSCISDLLRVAGNLDEINRTKPKLRK